MPIPIGVGGEGGGGGEEGEVGEVGEATAVGGGVGESGAAATSVGEGEWHVVYFGVCFVIDIRQKLRLEPRV